MTPEDRASKREAAVQGMIARGYSRERAEEILGSVSSALFGPGGRFAPAPSGSDDTNGGE